MMNNFLARLSLIWEIPQTIFRLRRQFHGTRRLDGKVVVITGANAGVGKETAYQLSLRGSKIIIGARNIQKSLNAIKEIKSKNPTANITALKLDLSSLKSVREFARQVAEQETTVDVLINNAGVANPCPELQSQEGFELQFASNYLGHFLLTLHLLPLMRKSEDSRIINVITQGYLLSGDIYFDNINLRNGSYGQIKAHIQSKLALVLFTREMAKRLGSGQMENNVKTYCINPGIVNSRGSPNALVAMLKKLFMQNISMGPQPYLYCALSEQCDNESGYFYDNCRRVDRMISQAVDDNRAFDLWNLSVAMTKLEDQYII